ncbi:MAG: DUF1573 domain-containing protein [Bacteroidota bacterium]
MSKYWITSLLLAFGLMAVSVAQDAPRIQFEKTTHEFGTIEQGAPAEYTFAFTNITDQDVKLTRVKASCGCTTPSWTREAVASGAKGTIKVAYNTNRVGPFTKTVTVNYDSLPRPVVLYIKGNVKGKAPEPVDIFKQMVGGLGFEKLNQSIGVIDSDKERELSFMVKNKSQEPIRFTGKYEHEMMFYVAADKMELKPGEMTNVKVTVKGENFVSKGAFTKQISLFTDEATANEKILTISGNLNKVYTEEELARLPNIAFEKTVYDGGVVIEGEVVKIAYKFTNTGKEDLVIENVRASCGCTATAPKDKIIKPGQTSEIMAEFNSRGRSGKQNKSITVRSNDPDNGTIMLRLLVEVEKDPFHIENAGPASTGQRR